MCLENFEPAQNRAGLWGPERVEGAESSPEVAVRRQGDGGKQQDQVFCWFVGVWMIILENWLSVWEREERGKKSNGRGGGQR